MSLANTLPGEPSDGSQQLVVSKISFKEILNQKPRATSNLGEIKWCPGRDVLQLHLS